MLAYLIEIGAYDPGFAGLTTLRFSSTPYLHPSAPGPYANRLREPPTFRRDIFSKNATGGAGAVSQGDVVIVNPDGDLDHLRDFGFAGQACSVLLGDPAGPYSAFSVLIRGVVEQALFDISEMRVRLKDRLQELAQPLQTVKFAGDNVLPDGLEGNEDLRGKPKGITAGAVLNVTPQCVNTTRLEFLVNDGPVADVPIVRDAGAILDHGPDYSSRTDMETNQPSPGSYRVWPAGGYFRLRTTPSGTLTADVLQATSPVERTAARVAMSLVTRPGGIPAGDIEIDDVLALDADNSSVVGIWLDSETTFGSALDQVLGSIGAWYGFDSVGKFRMQRLEAPGTPVVTLRKFGLGTDAAFNDLDLLDVRFLPTSDPDRGVPTWRVSLNYARNYTIETGNGVAGGVDNPTRTFLANEFRTVIATDPAVQTPNPLAVQQTVDTLIVNQADAQAEAYRLLALKKVRRDFLEVDTPLTPEALELLDLGKTVAVAIPRFGYDAGRALLITGMEYNTQKQILTLALWG